MGVECALNIWGYVTYADGTPAPNASVTDHGGSVTDTDRSGFYSFRLETPGSYTLTASHASTTFCQASKNVDHNAVVAVVNGGTRADIQLPCLPPL